MSWRPGSAVRWGLLVGASVVLGAFLWWWPGLTGSGQRPDVTVVGTGELVESREDLSRRLREAGLAVEWVSGVETWCDAADAVRQRSAGTSVVLAPDDLEPCSVPFERILTETFVGVADRTWIVAFSESAAVESLIEKGAERVPVERLIGVLDEPVPCVWWEDCPVSGSVVTRDVEGLTAAGRQRLARLITAQVA